MLSRISRDVPNSGGHAGRTKGGIEGTAPLGTGASNDGFMTPTWWVVWLLLLLFDVGLLDMESNHS